MSNYIMFLGLVYLAIFVQTEDKNSDETQSRHFENVCWTSLERVSLSCFPQANWSILSKHSGVFGVHGVCWVDHFVGSKLCMCARVCMCVRAYMHVCHFHLISRKHWGVEKSTVIKYDTETVLLYAFSGSTATGCSSQTVSFINDTYNEHVPGYVFQYARYM